MLVSFIQKYFSTSSLFPAIKTNYWEKGGVGSQCSMGTEVQFGKMKEVLALASMAQLVGALFHNQKVADSILDWAYT